MASETHQPCPEHKLSIAIEQEDKVDRIQRAQWLRAAILGANDGLLSTTSLMIGVGAAKEDHWSMVLSGIAGAVAGACSMAVGEYVSVSTQRDIEEAASAVKPGSTLCQLPVSHIKTPDHPKVQVEEAPKELPANASVSTTPNSSQRKVPIFSPRKSPLMRVISETNTQVIKDDGKETLPNPWKAALASALAFLCGSFLPLMSAIFFSDFRTRVVALVMVTSVALVFFGGMGAYLGGSPVRASAWRVLAGGLIAMAITYGLLSPFDREKKVENDE